MNSIILFSLIASPLGFFPAAAVSISVDQPSHQYYHYKQGEGREKTNFETNTLLTLNVDMLKGRLPKLYGGVTAPVEERAKRLGSYVAKEHPDLFLSQEIPLESAWPVYEALKDQFPHFWMGMGLEPGKKESGLFVASKYPLVSEPVFVPFPDAMQRIYNYPDELHDLYPIRILERGFFGLETADCWIVTSHMEPGNPEQGGSYRREQLAFITREMDRIAKGKPYLLTGDLNIRRTGEPGDDYSKSGIGDLYYDFYTEQHPNFDESTYTCTSLLEAHANGYPEPVDPKDRNEIDDYVLIRKLYKDRFKNLQVQLLKDTYDVSKDPSEALTDHRAYRAIFSISRS